jgi:hypothetical protein
VATGGLSILRPLRAAAFVLLLAYWTYLLLKPSPFPDTYIPEFSWFDKELLKFLLAKLLHLGVYTFFAILGGSLVPAGRGRALILAGLVLHGAASEVGQWVGGTYLGTNRHGTVRDVLIDAAGVAVGAVALRRWDRVTSR